MSLYMPLFKSCKSLRALTQLHAHLLTFGHGHSAQASTKLIQSYSEMGSPESAQLVFNTFQTPDSFMWGVLMKCFVWSGLFKDAILQYIDMIRQNVETTSFIYPSVLRACAGFGDIVIGEVVHERIVKLGFGGDDITDTALMSMYGELGFVTDACKVFDEMPKPDIVAWASIISSFVQNGRASYGLWMFRRMVDAEVGTDPVTMLTVTEACGEMGCPRLARSAHGHVVRMGMEKTDLDNSLAVMYGKCNDLNSAEILFRTITDSRSVSSWSSMMFCYNQAGCFEQALEVFAGMLRSQTEPNSVTMTSVIGSCIGLGCLKEGKSVHCYIIRKAFELDYSGPALVDFYANRGKIQDSIEVFNTIPEKTIILWNMLISAHIKKGFLSEASKFLAQMRNQGLFPDAFTLSSILSACADMGCSELGCQIHSHSIKTCCSDEEFVANALIDMYSKCGSIDSAYQIFNSFERRSVVTWNSMISGFSQAGNPAKAVNLFTQMYDNSLEMNNVTFLTAIQACANAGYIEKGKWVHHKLITFGVSRDTFIDTALTDMYGKCGHLQTSRRVFDAMEDKSVVSWSSMISIYGMHGQISNAISIFDEMIKSGVKPNQVTFMNILSACSHAGCVEQGTHYFHMMQGFGVEVNSEHLACMIDLLSRAGDLKEAYEIIKSATFPVDASTWGALLNGCRIHGRMDLITDMKKDLLDIETVDTGYYTLLSNVYAEGGNWIDFGRVRSRMKNTGLSKVPAYSSIEAEAR